MSTSFSFNLVVDVPATQSPAAAALPPLSSRDPLAPFLGYGLITPFQRDRKDDFAQDGGAKLVASAVRQVLGTRGATQTSQGELPWRTEFGSQLHLLRHVNNDQVAAELARVYVTEAITRWEPRANVTNVEVVPQSTPEFGPLSRMQIRVSYDVQQPEPGSGAVVLSSQSTIVEV